MDNKILTGSRVLVTGGAGFIGSNLVETLLDQDNFVVCLDNFSTGKRKNIEAFSKRSHFRFIEGDIRNLEDCKRSVSDVSFVLHQAALGSVPRSVNDPVTTNNVNIGGFVNMLTAAKDAGIKRFVYAASSSTYGDHPGLPKLEDQIGRPLSPYAVTKYCNELYAGVFASLYGMECIGLRYFNVFGKRQDPDGPYAAVIPKFASQLIRREAPLINGDGSHSRDFTYIKNVVNINQLALLTNNTDAINTVYNVAYGCNTSLNQLFDLIRQYLSEFDPEIGKINPVYGPPRQGDVLHSLASVEKAKKLLGYQPDLNISEGLHETIPWYWENLK